MLLVWGVNR
uniref:Uncharacterized protein n=1 Tax=Anguilla anguilla TaxID=7936 RepID=A0A0E9R9G7_ANGAN